MRGDVEKQPDLIVTVSPEDLVPRDHPIRLVKKVADEALRRLGPRLGELYSERGRKSVPPEMLLKAQILIALYSVRSERLFCERLQYDFLFRWFLDLPGVGTAFALTQLKSTFATTNGLERALGLPVLGAISRSLTPDQRAFEAKRTKMFFGGAAALVGVLVVLLAIEVVQVGSVA